MSHLPPELMRSITWDQGTEMACHLEIVKSLGSPVHFCDSRSPWQLGSREKTNGLLRDYFPKGTDLSVHAHKHLLAVEKELEVEASAVAHAMRGSHPRVRIALVCRK